MELTIDRKPIVVTPETTVRDAIAQMKPPDQNNAVAQTSPQPKTCILVGQENTLLGFLTERDILLLIAQDIDLAQVTVSSVMEHPGITIRRSHLNNPLSLLSQFSEHQTGYFVILEDEEPHNIYGVITLEQLCLDLNKAGLLANRKPQVIEPQAPIDSGLSPSIFSSESHKSIDEDPTIISQLKANFNRLNYLLNYSPAILYTADPVTYETTFISENVKTILGYEASSFLENPKLWQEYIHPEDQVILSWIIQRLSNSNSQTCDYRFRDAQGQYHWLRNEILVIRDEHNHPQELIGYCITVDDLKETEKNLRTSEQQFRSIFEQADVGITQLSPTGSFLKVNPKFMEIVQYSKEELLRTTYQKITYPQDLAQDLTLNYQLLIGKISRFAADKRYVRKDGSIVWVHWSGCVVRGIGGKAESIIAVVQDISEQQAALHERKQAELALQESESILRSFYDSSTMMMGVVELTSSPEDLLHIWSNSMTAEFVGLPAKQMEYKTAQELGIPDNITREWIQYCKHIQTTGKPVQFQCLYKHNGKNFWLLTTLSPIRNDNRIGSRFCYITEDVTERKQTERILAQTTQTLLQAQKIAHIGYWDYNVISHQLIWNKETFEIFGRDWNEPEPTYTQYIAQIHPEDRIKYQTALEHSLMTGERFEVEYRLLRGSGEIRYLYGQAEVETNSQGMITRLFGVVIDITEKKHAEESLKASEAKYRLLVEQMPAVTYTAALDDLSTTLYVSPQIEQMLGYPLREWLLQPDRWYRAVHPDDRDKVTQVLKIAHGGPTTFSREYRIFAKSGEMLWVRDRARIVTNEAGEPIFLQGMMFDMTEQKNSEEELQHAYTHLEATNHRLEISLKTLEQRNHEQAITSQMLEFLQACSTSLEAYPATAEFLKVLFPHCFGSIFLPQANNKALEAVSIFGDLSPTQSTINTQDCWALLRGKTHYASHHQPGLFCRHVDQTSRPTATLCIPMMVQGVAIGLFYLCTQDSAEIEPEKQQLAQTVSEQIALAISNLQLRETLQNQSICDPLTGLFNRRYLEQSLQQNLQTAELKEQPVSLIMIDVDHFKQFNDTYGHDAGDFVLQTLAEFLQKQVRESDIVCRYGGEEFTLILPNVSLELAYERAELLRKRIKKLPLNYQGKNLGQLSFSAGLATFPEQGDTVQSLIRRADEALYDAKRQGRDRVICANTVLFGQD
ncbi:PAS domain-containing protein [Spirulina subsalsa FACHB-351]|uniref:PAS domain-containing protein n=1 Tax=Spirulina subsalsa FACHB-351 TaxID=234711 RepID=A0ABT3L475_9CYAN|nr:PAS domain-containing protein [Spirulina subsalsa]MCW6036308.1 PAS domain-containing protein [Spirulina subsalsa FACHB-351]